jgi:hypothetical protein
VTTNSPLPPPNWPLTDKNTSQPYYSWFMGLEANRVSGSRIRLTEDTDFYVVPSTGSDTTGIGTLANPFATPQGAYDYCLRNIDAAGYFIKIRMFTATFTSTSKRRTTDEFSSDVTVLTINAPIPGCPCVEFEGSTVVNAGDYSGNLTVWDANGGHCVFVAAESGLYRFQGIAFVDTAVSKGGTIFAFNSCTISVQHCDFGETGDYHFHIGANCILKLFGDYSISGGAGNAHMFIESSVIDHETSTVTLTNTPAFISFVNLAHNSLYLHLDVTYSGSATGLRYVFQHMSDFITDAANPSPDDIFPGDAHGIKTIGDEGNGWNGIYLGGTAYSGRPTAPSTTGSVYAHITDATTNAWGAAITGGSTYQVVALNKFGSTVWRVMGI